MSSRAVSLLIVEDDEVDLMGIKRALNDLKIANPIIHAKDGLDAIERQLFLFSQPRMRMRILLMLIITMLLATS